MGGVSAVSVDETPERSSRNGFFLFCSWLAVNVKFSKLPSEHEHFPLEEFGQRA